MSDSNNPSVFTQPRGDDDDVLGHRVQASEAPDIMVRDGAPGVAGQNEDDVKGHRYIQNDRVQQNDDEDDVEGHRQIPVDRVMQNDDEDDVEGHRKA